MRSPGRAPAVLLLAAAVASCAPHPPSGTPDTPRPVVLLVHGRGMQERDPAEVRREWVSALERGLSAVSRESPFTESDFRMVWYADALDPVAPTACRSGPEGAAGTGPGKEVESVIGAIGSLVGAAAEWTAETGGPGLRSVAADLLYFGDEERRCAADERLADALDRATEEGRPVVLVAHSFGSFLVYRYLHLRGAGGEPTIARLVTIGSLVGLPEVGAFLFDPAGRSTGLPPGVRSWVNVRDPRDPLSAPLVDVRAAGSDPTAVVDRTTAGTTSGSGHPATHYLEDPVTARAVLDGWCAALEWSGSAAQVCGPR